MQHSSIPGAVVSSVLAFQRQSLRAYTAGTSGRSWCHDDGKVDVGQFSCSGCVSEPMLRFGRQTGDLVGSTTPDMVKLTRIAKAKNSFGTPCSRITAWLGSPHQQPHCFVPWIFDHSSARLRQEGVEGGVRRRPRHLHQEKVERASRAARLLLPLLRTSLLQLTSVKATPVQAETRVSAR